MSASERERLRALAEAATPGPWTNQGYDETEDAHFVLGGGEPMSQDEHQVAATLSIRRGGADAAYIAACSPDALLALLDALDAAANERERFRIALQEVQGIALNGPDTGKTNEQRLADRLDSIDHVVSKALNGV